MKLSAKKQRTIIHNALVSGDPEKALVELLLFGRVRQPTGVRARAAEALAGLDEISNMELVKDTFLCLFGYEEQEVLRKAAITCAFLGINEAVPIVLGQLSKVHYGTAVPYLKALCVFQDERARKPLGEYAKGLSSVSGLLSYVALVLGFLDLVKVNDEKMAPQDVWNRLR